MSAKRLRAGIIVIGTELVIGQSRDRNSEYLGDWLSHKGFDTRFIIKVPDDIEIIAEELRQAVDKVDLLILTGGLGSTHDDVTRDAISVAGKKRLKPDPEMSDKIERLIPPGADREAFMRQAYLPEGASWLGPVKGSAPGIAVELKGTIVYALPGVPAEMTAMLEQISSDLQNRFGATSGTAMKKVKLKGLSEPEASRLVDPIITSYQHLTFNILASSKDIVITIISQDDNVGRQDLDKAVEAVIDCLGGSVYGFDDQTLSRVVGELLSEKGLSLGIAESLTGGRIAAEITATPGSSKYFAGAVVAYENEIKHELLKVSDKTLTEKGAVSSETALEMARGVRDSLGVDVGLSSTGISGPEGGSTDKPIGLVFIAVSDKYRETVREFRFGGDRDAIQNNSAFTALNMLRLFLSDHDRQ